VDVVAGTTRVVDDGGGDGDANWDDEGDDERVDEQPDVDASSEL
jgi:hypothetical protein